MNSGGSFVHLFLPYVCKVTDLNSTTKSGLSTQKQGCVILRLIELFKTRKYYRNRKQHSFRNSSYFLYNLYIPNGIYTPANLMFFNTHIYMHILVTYANTFDSIMLTEKFCITSHNHKMLPCRNCNASNIKIEGKKTIWNRYVVR